MARYNGQITARSSSYKGKRRAMEESMLEYYTHARQTNAIYNHLSRVNSVAPGVQPQFKDTNTDEAIFTRKNRHPDIVDLELLHLTMEHEYYKTKRHQEFEIPRHGSKSQGTFAVTSGENDVGRRSKNHMNATMNDVNALGQYQWSANNSQNNILKRESARRRIEPRYGNGDQYGDHRAHRPRLRLDPLDLRSLEHDVNRDDLVRESNQSTIPLKLLDINDSSFASTDKKFQIDVGFRRKQLFPVVEDMNNAKLQHSASKLLDSTENNDFKTNILRIASQPDLSQTHAESQYPDSASLPIRLLQRPQRAKRMDLHTPDLPVISESGDMCIHPKHLELDRKEMLSSKPLLIRKTHCINTDRNGTESRRETEGLKRQIMQAKIHLNPQLTNHI